jgi:hypothetical protein
MNPTPLEQAIEALEAKAADAGPTTAGNGWRHAALVCRLNWTVPRMLRQLRRHASHFADSDPDKVAAYREAGALLQQLTGATALPDPAAVPLTATLSELFDLARLP